MRLPISPTSLAELGRSHVKKFHTIISFIQHHGEISPHQPGYHSVARWFNVTIEPDANCWYSWLVKSISQRFFLNDVYLTLIVSSNMPGDVNKCSLLPGLFGRQLLPPNFWAWHHTTVVIHSISLSLPVSPFRQQPCLKAQTTEQ
jgi:hypothetical protein